ncbi:hypothetical protein TCA2_3572 [Paenibacillus sp. TCA20]|uniref:Imm26 family immunity protein n=1 Tax=Paenibacillus TaxID=44249 RepID=UPI0004D4A49C|nr:hypothetical protein TCA2_3572 [Paenibacillus sp. TCA20]
MFSLKLEENLFYYGKVIKVELESTNVFLRGWYLIHIYDHPTKTRIDPSERGSINQSLIIPPIVTNNKGWIDGYFLTVDNIPVTNTDLSIDYGFWDIIPPINKAKPLACVITPCGFFLCRN